MKVPEAWSTISRNQSRILKQKLGTIFFRPITILIYTFSVYVRGLQKFHVPQFTCKMARARDFIDLFWKEHDQTLINKNDCCVRHTKWQTKLLTLSYIQSFNSLIKGHDIGWIYKKQMSELVGFLNHYYNYLWLNYNDYIQIIN